MHVMRQRPNKFQTNFSTFDILANQINKKMGLILKRNKSKFRHQMNAIGWCGITNTSLMMLYCFPCFCLTAEHTNTITLLDYIFSSHCVQTTRNL